MGAASAVFDVFYAGTLGYGLYKVLTGEDASAEKEIIDVVSKYRADLGVLRAKYEKEMDDFFDKQRKKLGQP